MKAYLRCIFTMALFLFGIVHAYAADIFIDDMDSPSSQENIQYQNLSLPHFPSSLGADKTYLLLSQKNSPGSVLYHVNGVSSMTISIYSQTGTFVTASGSQLKLGGSASGFISRALFDTGKKVVYTNTEKGSLIYTKNGQGLPGVFSMPPSGFSPSSSLYYGVNVEVSANGQQFKSLSPTLQSVTVPKDGKQHYYETYSLSIPDGVSYLRIRLYDLSFIPDSSFDGTVYPVTTPLSLCLANIQLEGENLVWGNLPPAPKPEPEPVPPIPKPPVPEPPAPEPVPPPDIPSNPDDNITEENLSKPPFPEETEPPNHSGSSHSTPSKPSKPSLGNGIHSSVGSFQKEGIPGVIKISSRKTQSSGRRYSSSPKNTEPSTTSEDKPNVSVAVDPSISSSKESYRKTVSFSSGLYLAGISLCITFLVIRSHQGGSSS